MASHSGVGGDELDTTVGDELGSVIDGQIQLLIEERAAEIEDRVAELEAELEDLDNFARITLKERRIAENNANIAKVSDSFSGFAENTTDKLNSLNSRMEINTLLLATIAEALGEADDVDVDLSEVQHQYEDQVVTNTSADERLAEAIEALSS